MDHNLLNELSNRIYNVKCKSAYKHLFKILYDNNASYIINKNGVYMDLYKINEETYNTIILYLDEFDSINKKAPINQYTLIHSKESTMNYNNITCDISH